MVLVSLECLYLGDASLAQLMECSTLDLRVVSSSPTLGGRDDLKIKFLKYNNKKIKLVCLYLGFYPKNLTQPYFFLDLCKPLFKLKLEVKIPIRR